MTTTTPAPITYRQDRLMLGLAAAAGYHAASFSADFVDFGAPFAGNIDQICEWLCHLDASAAQAMNHRLAKLCYHPDVFDPVAAIRDAALDPDEEEAVSRAKIAVHQVAISFFQNNEHKPTPTILADEMGVMIEAAPDETARIAALVALDELIDDLSADEPNRATDVIDQIRMILSPEMDHDSAVAHRIDAAHALAITFEQLIAEPNRTGNVEL